MKKLVALLLAVAMCMTLCACGGVSKEQEAAYREALMAESWVVENGNNNEKYGFGEDGMGSHSKKSNSSNFMSSSSMGFTWELKGDKLTMDTTTISFSSNKIEYNTIELKVAENEETGEISLVGDSMTLIPYSRNPKTPVFFDECTMLPQVDSIVEARSAGRSSSSTNGKLTRVAYQYESDNDKLTATMVLEMYIAELNKMGFVMETVSPNSYDIIHNNIKIANASLDGTNRISIDIVPEGNRAQPVSHAKTISLGETIKTDKYEFTLNKVELTYKVLPKNTNGYYHYFPADEGKVYIHVDGDFYNTSKRDYLIGDLFVPKADYNNGFTYEGFVVVEEGNNDFAQSKSDIACAPLETCGYHGLIECPEVVESTDLPLFIVFSTSDGTTYRYDIRK